MPNDDHVKHYNTTTHEAWEPKGEALRFKVPEETKWKKALNGHDGGRKRCDYCHLMFSANYVREVRGPRFESREACGLCIRDLKLVKL